MLRRFKNPIAIPLFIFFLGFSFTLFVAHKTQNWIRLTEESRFETAITHTSLLIQKRLESNIQLVRSIGGLFKASDHVSREDFKRFVKTHDLLEQFPGIQAVGFGPLVPHETKMAFEKNADIKDYFIFPSTQEMAVPVYYLEPFTPHNNRALGYDMASESLRKTAMEHALRRHQPSLSQKIELLQDEENRAGFLIYFPAFSLDDGHLGFVYAAINAKKLFDGILKDRYIPIDFELYDTDASKETALLYTSNPTLKNPRLSRLVALPLHGHTWILSFKANHILDLGLSIYMPLIQLIFGSLLSLAISAWVYVLMHTQRRALFLADKMTHTIQEQLRVIDENVIYSSTNIEGMITDVSQAFCRVTGFTKEELIGQDHLIIRHPDTPSSVYDDLWKTIKKGNIWKGELKNLRKNGSHYWVLAVISPKKDEEGNIIGFTSIRQDITDKKRAEELSITDPLTGLCNRLKLDELFHTYIHVSQRHGTPFSILLLDIDRFKSVNDTYGHQVGDTVLQEFADILRKNVRTEDVVGRWGGEEFMILAPGSDIEAAKRLAQKLRVEVETFSFSTIGHKTCSFGVSSYHKGDDEKSMVSRADDALYRAKANGRNRVEIETAQAASTALMPH